MYTHTYTRITNRIKNIQNSFIINLFFYFFFQFNHLFLLFLSLQFNVYRLFCWNRAASHTHTLLRPAYRLIVSLTATTYAPMYVCMYASNVCICFDQNFHQRKLKRTHYWLLTFDLSIALEFKNTSQTFTFIIRHPLKCSTKNKKKIQHNICQHRLHQRHRLLQLRFAQERSSTVSGATV